MGTEKISLSNVLFSKAQQYILRLLYGQPQADFYTNEIIRLSNTGRGAIQRELAKLTAAGVITVNQIGNQKRYQANRSNPLFTELRSIILKTFGMTDIIREVLLPVAKKIQFAFIYGSIAKQEDTAESDIDLMIISEKLTYTEIFKLLDTVEGQLGRKINPTFYSLSEWLRKHRQKNHFVTKVFDQPKIFLIGTENEFAQFG